MSKPEFDPGGMGQSIRQMNASVVIYKQEDVCVALLSDRGGMLKHGSKGNTGKRIKKKTFTWLTACVLFCHAGAMQGWAEGGQGE